MSVPVIEPVTEPTYRGTWECGAGGTNCTVKIVSSSPSNTPLSPQSSSLLLASDNSEIASVPSETEILVQRIIRELGVKETEQNKYNIIRKILMDITTQIKGKITLNTENQVKSMIEQIIPAINESTNLEEIKPQLQQAITVQLGYNTSDQLREALRELLSRINTIPTSKENSAFVNAATKLVEAKRAFANNPTPNTKKTLDNISVAAEATAAAAAKRQQRINNKNKDNAAKQNVGVGGLFGNNDNQNSDSIEAGGAITPFGQPVSRNSIKVPSVPLKLYENTRISDLFNNLNASKKGRLELFPEQRKRNLLGALITLPVEVQQDYVTAFFNLTLEEQNRIFDKLQANPSLKMNELLAIKNEGGGRKRTRRGKRGGRGTRRRV